MKVSFREIEIADAEMIGRWRTSPRVAQFLNTEVDYDLRKQQDWIESSRLRPDYYHWLILIDGIEVGHIQITGLDLINKTAEWGYFIGDEEATGAGSYIPTTLFAFCFKSLGLESITCQCLHINTRVIALNQAFGHRFAPELDHVVQKAHTEFLSVGLRLDRETYLKSRFSTSTEVLPTELWHANPSRFNDKLSSL